MNLELTRTEWAEWANAPVPEIEDVMHAALNDIFTIPLRLETGFATNVIVNGDDAEGNVSVYTKRGIVVEAHYTNLVYNRTTQAWWVHLDSVEFHDDPQQFEDE